MAMRESSNGIDTITNSIKKLEQNHEKHMSLYGVDNEKNYFLRIAEELIRYKRKQQFMFQPQVY